MSNTCNQGRHRREEQKQCFRACCYNLGISLGVRDHHRVNADGLGLRADCGCWMGYSDEPTCKTAARQGQGQYAANGFSKGASSVTPSDVARETSPGLDGGLGDLAPCYREPLGTGKPGNPPKRFKNAPKTLPRTLPPTAPKTLPDPPSGGAAEGRPRERFWGVLGGSLVSQSLAVPGITDLAHNVWPP